MTTRLMPNEVLTFGQRPRGCLNCGQWSFFEWSGIALCCMACLESLAEEWGAEMMEAQGERTEYEQRIDNAPDVPSWWPYYPVYGNPD